MSRLQQIELLLSGVTDANGDPLSAGTVTFYEAGTDTLKNVYDRNGAYQANPYTLDSAGKALLYGLGNYKMVIKDAAGTTLYTHNFILCSDFYNYVYGGTSGGAANVFVISPNPVLRESDYETGLMVSFIADKANTGAAVLSIADTNGSAGTKQLTNLRGNLVGGEIQAGDVVVAIYNGSTFDIVSQDSSQWIDYTPTYGGNDAMQYNSVTKYKASYLQTGKLLNVGVRTTAGTIAGTPNTTVLVSSPVSLANKNAGCNNGCWIYENGAWKIGHCGYYSADYIAVEKADGSAWTAGNAYVAFTAILAVA